MINYDLIRPLPERDIVFGEAKLLRKKDIYLRVLFFDPAPLYERVKHKLRPTGRHQGIQMEDIFPKLPDPICACGCGKAPKSGSYKNEKTWHRKFATEACQQFCNDVLSIMNNYFGKPAFYIDLYEGHKCSECPETNMLELDHVVGVKHGGGACWLSNYVWRCKACHTKKTNKDFGKGDFKGPNQVKCNFPQ